MNAPVRLQLGSFIVLVVIATIGSVTLAIASARAAETTTTTTHTTTTTSETQPVSKLSDPQYPLSVPATTRSEALMKARLGAGRLDPFTPTSGGSHIVPLNPLEIKPLKTAAKVHLPPPPKFSPPPPPPGVVTLPGMAGEAVGSAGMGSSENDLPEPPDKPTIANKLKLVGLVDNKAFFTFTDLEMRKANKFPSTVILASGEQFESVHLVSLDKNSVVLEEDGERITKELERIR